MVMAFDDDTIVALKKFIDSLNHESNMGSTIIVEGKRDLRALRIIGLTGNVLIFNNFRGISNFVDFISENKKKVILLFDMDKKGKMITSKVLHKLHSNFINNGMCYKKKLTKITKGRVKHIEDLYVFSELMEEIIS